MLCKRGRRLGRFAVLAAGLCLWAGRTAAAAQAVTVDITPGHFTNSYSPMKALGAGVDAQNAGAVANIYVPATVKRMLAGGWGPVSYRLYTELSVQHWHWNPVGSWSDSSGHGYWTGSTTSTGQILDSYGYRLPHRGFTHDQGNDDDYSRLADGDLTTYWKSNPYLTHLFTGEADALHPQWVVADLGSSQPIDAVRIFWVEPHAAAYEVQYWTGTDAINDPAHGQWVTFPSGSVTGGKGGTVTLKLSGSPIPVEFLRILMTASSDTCDSHGSADRRNCVGYAIAELGIGTLNGNNFNDLVVHASCVPGPDGCGTNNTQTVTYASSVDPWHAPANRVTDEEQAGLDRVFTSGLTRGLPTMIAVGMLYGTPDDAAAEIRYLEAHGYPISYVEMGEEPDGQYILPEDYGALYLQWARALHTVEPDLKLGGPVFQGAKSDVQVWPDSTGNTSWLNRFLLYLESHGESSLLSFMSFEHYPFDPCDPSIWQDLLDEPAVVRKILQAWAADGLPANLPKFITEYQFSADTASVFQDITGALWLADFNGSFLTAGGSGMFLYQYEPEPLVSTSANCTSYGAYGMFSADANNHIRANTSEFFAAQMITQQWSQPVDALHLVYPATSAVTNGSGKLLMTAYAVQRPDGKWALMLVNKDQFHSHDITVTFHDSAARRDHYFKGQVTMVTFGSTQYKWHPNGPNGYPLPDGPALTTLKPGGSGTVYTIPAASVTVLRGTVQ
jgi:hypothetical protein